MSPDRKHPDGRVQRGQVHRGRSVVQQLVLVFFLVLLWVMLWDSVTVLGVLSGIVVAMLITRVFYLPPVVLSGRFNIWHALVFGLWFLWSLVLASVEVAWMAFRPRAVGAGSVIACDLRTSSDLLMTLIADTASLIPGSIIVDSDRAQGVLYLHVLDCDSEEKVLEAKKQVYLIERLLIRALGSARDLAALRVHPEPIEAHPASHSAQPPGSAASTATAARAPGSPTARANSPAASASSAESARGSETADHPREDETGGAV